MTEREDALLLERDYYRAALARIFNRYHDRPLIGRDERLAFDMKEIALIALSTDDPSGSSPEVKP